MPIVIEPESGIPFPFDTTPEEIELFRDRAKAAVETIREIVALGGEVEITEEDRVKARGVAASNAPLKISEKNGYFFMLHVRSGQMVRVLVCQRQKEMCRRQSWHG